MRDFPDSLMDQRLQRLRVARRIRIAMKRTEVTWDPLGHNRGIPVLEDCVCHHGCRNVSWTHGPPTSLTKGPSVAVSIRPNGSDWSRRCVFGDRIISEFTEK